MKTAIVIPTRDAVRRGVWQEVLDAISHQDFQPDERIIVDSGSADSTVRLAAARRWKIIRIHSGDFDHGSTRDRIVRSLYRRGFDTAIFLSQDVILSSPCELKKLVGFLYAHPISGCCGRQISRREHSFDAWQRQCCYQSVSQIKTEADIPRLGWMTPFCSNAFSAWKTADVVKFGGFPPARFGEDMLLAAKVIRSGGAIGYCADAVAVHEHSDALPAMFMRGMAVGGFHREHPEFRREFRSFEPPWPPRGELRFMILPFLAKSLGYVCGRGRDALIPGLIFALMWLLLIPAIRLYDFPMRDIADRYAPMAEAVAAGDWHFAFHPRITPLLPLLAGVIVRLFRCGGYAACQLAAALMLTGGIFPLYRGCLLAYGRRTAVWAGLMYVGCSSLFRLGYYGIREAGGVLGITLLFHAAAKLRTQPRRYAGYLLFAAAEAILLSSRGDLASFALAALVVLSGWDIFANRHPLRSMAATLLVLLAISPLLYYNYRMIGYPVPEIRHGVALRIVCRKIPVLKFLKNPAPRIPLDIGGFGEKADE